VLEFRGPAPEKVNGKEVYIYRNQLCNNHKLLHIWEVANPFGDVRLNRFVIISKLSAEKKGVPQPIG
jgi:hypothetical protein